MRRRRGNNEIELLPNDADLDGLPDSAVSQRFEDLSFSQYAVFWPTGRREQPRVAEARGRNTRGMGSCASGSGHGSGPHDRDEWANPGERSAGLAVRSGGASGSPWAWQYPGRDQCAVPVPQL